MKLEEAYDFLIGYGIANEREMNLVCCINGFSIETINQIVYARTGYASLEQYEKSEIDLEDE